MPNIWILRPNGKIFHLPVSGENDINTPDTAILLNAVGLRDRAYSGTVQIVHPTLGTFSISFDPPGRTGGPCNQCGLCCTHPVANCPMPPNNCGYILDTQYNVHKLGKANGTVCGVRSTIFEVSKACTISPDRRETWMTSCPFVYSGE
jgi:hypothetical protein